MNLKLAFCSIGLLLTSNSSLQAAELTKEQINNLYRSADSIYSCTSGVKPQQMEILKLFSKDNGDNTIVTDIELTTNLSKLNTIYLKVKKDEKQSFDGHVVVYDILNSSEYSGFHLQIRNDNISTLNLFSKNMSTLFKCYLEY